MYSWEIENELKRNNYKVNAYRINQIKEESCQVKILKLIRVEETFFTYEMKTDDGYTWEIEAKKIF